MCWFYYQHHCWWWWRHKELLEYKPSENLKMLDLLINQRSYYNVWYLNSAVALKISSSSKKCCPWTTTLPGEEFCFLSLFTCLKSSKCGIKGQGREGIVWSQHDNSKPLHDIYLTSILRNLVEYVDGWECFPFSIVSLASTPELLCNVFLSLLFQICRPWFYPPPFSSLFLLCVYYLQPNVSHSLFP